MKAPIKKHLLRMALGFVTYALGLVALNAWDAERLPHRYWLVLLPGLPTVYLATTIIGCVSGLDEMRRKIATEAMAFSGLATGFTCFSYLFLRDMGAPEFRPEWALYILCVYYWIGLFFSWRRYL